jgi:hypothetical protein
VTQGENMTRDDVDNLDLEAVLSNCSDDDYSRWRKAIDARLSQEELFDLEAEIRATFISEDD